MDQERYQVREIEDARERVADDVQSVAENANVVKRAKEAAQSKIEGAKSAIGNAGGKVRDLAGNVNPVENPIGMLLAGLALGFLIGMLLPVTRFESERIGPLTEDMKERMRDARSEVMRRGGEVIKETLEGGKASAMNAMRDQTKDLTGSGSSEA